MIGLQVQSINHLTTAYYNYKHVITIIKRYLIVREKNNNSFSQCDNLTQCYANITHRMDCFSYQMSTFINYEDNKENFEAEGMTCTMYCLLYICCTMYDLKLHMLCGVVLYRKPPSWWTLLSGKLDTIGWSPSPEHNHLYFIFMHTMK